MASDLLAETTTSSAVGSTAAQAVTPCPAAVRAAVQAMFSALQEQAARLGQVLRQPPPEPTTCCGRGCNGCVWESYYAAAAWWKEEALQALDA